MASTPPIMTNASASTSSAKENVHRPNGAALQFPDEQRLIPE
jgi:hypothetical protein